MSKRSRKIFGRYYWTPSVKCLLTLLPQCCIAPEPPNFQDRSSLPSEHTNVALLGSVLDIAPIFFKIRGKARQANKFECVHQEDTHRSYRFKLLKRRAMYQLCQQFDCRKFFIFSIERTCGEGSIERRGDHVSEVTTYRVSCYAWWIAFNTYLPCHQG